MGYLLDVDGQRVFIAGDTDKTKENSAVQCDIALVPVGGKFTMDAKEAADLIVLIRSAASFTMDAKEAADLINTIRPAVAIPTHYGTIVGKKSDGERFASLVDPAIETKIILQD